MTHFYRLTTYTRLGEVWEVQDFSKWEDAYAAFMRPLPLKGGYVLLPLEPIPL